MQRRMASGYAEQVTADVATLGGEHLRQCFDRKLGQEEPRYLSHQAEGRTSSEEASACASTFQPLLFAGLRFTQPLGKLCSP